MTFSKKTFAVAVCASCCVASFGLGSAGMTAWRDRGRPTPEPLSGDWWAYLQREINPLNEGSATLLSPARKLTVPDTSATPFRMTGGGHLALSEADQRCFVAIADAADGAIHRFSCDGVYLGWLTGPPRQLNFASAVESIAFLGDTLAVLSNVTDSLHLFIGNHPTGARGRPEAMGPVAHPAQNGTFVDIPVALMDSSEATVRIWNGETSVSLGKALKAPNKEWAAELNASQISIARDTVWQLRMIDQLLVGYALNAARGSADSLNVPQVTKIIAPMVYRTGPTERRRTFYLSRAFAVSQLGWVILAHSLDASANRTQFISVWDRINKPVVYRVEGSVLRLAAGQHHFVAVLERPDGSNEVQVFRFRD